MTVVGPETLTRRVDALAGAVDLLRPHLPADELAPADAVAHRARGRMRHGSRYTVVALAGQTGSGKSSLVNTLADREVAPVGVTRPTTSRARAVVFGDGRDAAPLLDWLGVPERDVVPADDELDGLVLLDLPDVDSVATAHHLEAHRLIDRVDRLVFVTDPQKYADEALHIGELQRLADHAEVLEVVLSQVDRLTDEQQAACLQDLRRRLADDGLVGARPHAVSSVTGEGLPAMRDRLAEVIRGRHAMLDRVEADVAAAARELHPGGPNRGADALSRGARRRAVDGLADAIGVDRVVEVVVAEHRRDARLATGWPPLRWAARWRRSPTASLPAVGRSRAATDTVRATLRDVGEQAGDGLDDAWARRVRDAARSQQDDVVEALAGVATRDVEALRTRPWWWRVVGLLHGVLVVAALVGAVWLVALQVFEVALLVDAAEWVPRWRGLPLPTMLLLGGILGGIALALLARLLVRLGARRRGRRARRRLRAAVDRVVTEHVEPPIVAVLAGRAEAAHLLAEAAGQ